MKQSDYRKPPLAAKKPQVLKKFGVERKDDYYWLKDKSNPEVIDYLNAENEYTKDVMAHTEELQKKIFEEIKGRIKEDDVSCPFLDNGYYYYDRMEIGKQYPIHCRKQGSLSSKEEILFDLNQMAEGQGAFIFPEFVVSPDNTMAAYIYNTTGSFAEFDLKIRKLETGEDLDFIIHGVTSFVWSNDSKMLVYNVIDSALRPWAVYRVKIDDPAASLSRSQAALLEPVGQLIYKEEDAKFRVGVYKDKVDEFIGLHSQSSATSEVRLLSGDDPTADFFVFRKREQSVEYGVDTHKDCFVVQYKDKKNPNKKIYMVPKNTYEDQSTWKELLPHREEVRLEEMALFHKFLAVEARKNGLVDIEIIHLDELHLDDLANQATLTPTIDLVHFPEEVYSAWLGANPEYNVETLRYGYDALNRPRTVYQYDVQTKESTALKVQEIPSGFNPEDYTVERLWATAKDGVKVPMAVVYKKGLKKDGSHPALLYSYGSYGYSTDVTFDLSVYSLVDRGFVYAIAQIRGGSDLGENWYEDGKLLKKMNTFTDFIACSEHLIKEGYTDSSKLSIHGGSAGGLLMGAVTNLRPDLFHSVVAAVPFVDVVTTMLDDTLPLTVGEYEEWGNPNEEEYFKYMLSYSPYDHVENKAYPHMMVTAGLNDSQVLYHEPAKFVAKLRDLKTDDHIVVLHTDMSSGHGGATGRYERIKDVARNYAFMLMVLD